MINIFIESTPNPESIKFITNIILAKNGKQYDYMDAKSAQSTGLPEELFTIPFIKGVFIASNFITITKTPSDFWEEIIPVIEEKIKGYLETGKDALIVSEEIADNLGDTTVDKIKSVLEDYVKPAVERDGGAILYKSFENGTLTLMLKGSCSGCPSASITLKAGIEGLMTKMVPEVKEVVANAM